MSIKNWPGGRISPTPPTPTGPFQDGSASGVWTLDQVAYWRQQGLWPIAGNVAPIGLFGGGLDAGTGELNSIQRIVIATTGNSTSFGDLTQRRYNLGAFSSSTRGCWAGGYSSSAPNNRSTVIDYVTISTTGNAVFFGQLTAPSEGGAGTSNDTRGLMTIGYNILVPGVVATINYVTIATTGNALTFGNLSVTRVYIGACASTTRALFVGGLDSSFANTVNVIDYVTIGTTGNAVDFGDLTVSRQRCAALSSSTRGVIGGGATGSNPVLNSSNVIDYVTIATTGNATDFGDLTVERCDLAGASSPTRGVFAGGRLNGTNQNVMDYITIASTGNALDFGDLATARWGLAGCSSSHGGI